MACSSLSASLWNSVCLGKFVKEVIHNKHKCKCANTKYICCFIGSYHEKGNNVSPSYNLMLSRGMLQEGLLGGDFQMSSQSEGLQTSSWHKLVHYHQLSIRFPGCQKAGPRHAKDCGVTPSIISIPICMSLSHGGSCTLATEDLQQQCG